MIKGLFKSIYFYRCIVIFFFFIAHFVKTEVYPIEQRNGSLPLTVSIIVPCHPLHVQFLKRLLDDYSYQTVLPEEIIISISERHRVNEEDIKGLKEFNWPFRLIVSLSSQRLVPGGNRNIASSLASGDIYVFQDADDIPHKQRVEIIKHFFSCYKIDHLMHSYIEKSGNFEKENYPFESIGFYRLIDSEKAFHFTFPVHFGQCAISRRVFNMVRWQEEHYLGEDVTFCGTIIKNFGFSLVIDAKLIIANPSLSACAKLIRGLE